MSLMKLYALYVDTNILKIRSNRKKCCISIETKDDIKEGGIQDITIQRVRNYLRSKEVYQESLF